MDTLGDTGQMEDKRQGTNFAKHNNLTSDT